MAKIMTREENEVVLFNNLHIERVNNGFILTIDKRQCVIIDSIYVFNTIEQLSEFIKNIDNPK